MASAISFSPFGHGRSNALLSVLEFKPASLETLAKEVPRFLKAAMMSARCQSLPSGMFFCDANELITVITPYDNT